MIPPTRPRACSDSTREGSTPGATAKTSGLLTAGTSQEQVENSEGGPGQAADQSHTARRRWGNLMNSVERGRCVDLMRGGEVCQPGLACANDVVDGRKSFSEILYYSPRAGVASLGVVCPETDAQHGVERTGISQLFCCECSEGIASWPGSVKTWLNCQ